LNIESDDETAEREADAVVGAAASFQDLKNRLAAL
jgi:hypothetical protein